nr:4Fe-4S binding protein [Caldicellulosiruptor naganoensis]
MCVQGVKQFIEKDELSVIIFRRKCAALEKYNYYYRLNEKCINCKACLTATGCPAISEDANQNVFIDKTLCAGCGLCANFCPKNVKEEEILEFFEKHFKHIYINLMHII